MFRCLKKSSNCSESLSLSPGEGGHLRWKLLGRASQFHIVDVVVFALGRWDVWAAVDGKSSKFGRGRFSFRGVLLFFRASKLLGLCSFTPKKKIPSHLSVPLPNLQAFGCNCWVYLLYKLSILHNNSISPIQIKLQKLLKLRNFREIFLETAHKSSRPEKKTF